MVNVIKKIKSNDDITIEFIGDSVTHGLNYCRPEETYVAKFAMLISKNLRTIMCFDMTVLF